MGPQGQISSQTPHTLGCALTAPPECSDRPAAPCHPACRQGYPKAEVTGGGVPLNELDCSSLESRRLPGVHVCGELCDVFGRIGGEAARVCGWGVACRGGVGSRLQVCGRAAARAHCMLSWCDTHPSPPCALAWRRLQLLLCLCQRPSGGPGGGRGRRGGEQHAANARGGRLSVAPFSTLCSRYLCELLFSGLGIFIKSCCHPHFRVFVCLGMPREL